MPHYVWQRGQVGERRSSGAATSILHSGLVFALLTGMAVLLLASPRANGQWDASAFVLLCATWAWIGLWNTVLLLNPSFLETLDGRLLGRLGWPNQLTLARLFFLPLVMGMVLRARYVEALVLFGVFALTDVLDGLLARRKDGATKLGFVLDPLADILFHLGVFGALCVAKCLPWWVGALVGLRYGILLLGCALLYAWKGEIWIRPTLFGKATGFVIGVLTGVLLLLLAIGEPAGPAREWTGRSIGALVGLGVLHVLVMGWINLRRPAQGGTAVYRRSFGLLVGRNAAPREP